MGCFVTQSYPTLCDPMDCSLPGVVLKVWGIWRLKHSHRGQQNFVCVSSSVMSCSVTPWTVALQAPLSMKLSRQEHWSGLPFPPPGNVPNPGTEPRSPTLQADSLLTEPPGKPSHQGLYSYCKSVDDALCGLTVLIKWKQKIQGSQHPRTVRLDSQFYLYLFSSLSLDTPGIFLGVEGFFCLLGLFPLPFHSANCFYPDKEQEYSVCTYASEHFLFTPRPLVFKLKRQDLSWFLSSFSWKVCLSFLGYSVTLFPQHQQIKG